MQKLCVICFYIGQPYDDGSILDYLAFGAAGSVVNELYSNLCPQCENRNCMIPIESFRAQKLIEDFRIYVPEIKEQEERKPDKLPWQKDESEK